MNFVVLVGVVGIWGQHTNHTLNPNFTKDSYILFPSKQTNVKCVICVLAPNSNKTTKSMKMQITHNHISSKHNTSTQHTTSPKYHTSHNIHLPMPDLLHAPKGGKGNHQIHKMQPSEEESAHNNTTNKPKCQTHTHFDLLSFVCVWGLCGLDHGQQVWRCHT